MAEIVCDQGVLLEKKKSPAARREKLINFSLALRVFYFIFFFFLLCGCVGE